MSKYKGYRKRVRTFFGPVEHDLWRPAGGYFSEWGDTYEVSIMGRVRRRLDKLHARSAPDGLMVQQINWQGYAQVTLSRAGKQKSIVVAYMVAETWFPPIEDEHILLLYQVRASAMSPNAVNIAWQQKLDNKSKLLYSLRDLILQADDHLGYNEAIVTLAKRSLETERRRKYQREYYEGVSELHGGSGDRLGGPGNAGDVNVPG